jgi:hypothetical protein
MNAFGRATAAAAHPVKNFMVRTAMLSCLLAVAALLGAYCPLVRQKSVDTAAMLRTRPVHTRPSTAVTADQSRSKQVSELPNPDLFHALML